jgi:hypothetical protein
MIRLLPARRSAERFDSLVEGGRRDDVDRTTSDLLELVGALRSVPEAQARPEFVAELRDRLMVAAATELKPVPAAARERDDVARLTVKPIRSRRERRIGLALATVAVMGATTSMAVASQSAIPGDALYPLKRAIENTEAGFSRGDDAKGEAILGNASERLDEVGKLSQKNDPDAALVTQTLHTFAQQFTDGSNSLLSDYEQNGDPSSIKQLHQYAAQSVDTLGALDGVIPPAAHNALVEAAGVVLAADAQALNVCPDPSCGEGILDVPGHLLADATVGGTSDNVAGGELPGTSPPSSQPQTQNGGKGSHNPSGLNPPETPIELPTPSAEASDGVGGLLPSGTATGGHSGSGTTGGGSGGKHKHHHAAGVDLDPVTDAVNDVVNGVVDGVNGLLNGLTGGQ